MPRTRGLTDIHHPRRRVGVRDRLATVEQGELGWKIERIAAGEYREQIAWVARRVTPAMAKRWPALKLGRWIIIDVDPYTGPVQAQPWPHEPGRLTGPFPRDDEGIELPF